MFQSVVLDTTWISIVIQFITGVLGIHGIFTPLPAEHAILTDVLKFETFVQVIEFMFYVWFVMRFNLGTMASTRYFDWVITTPTMLFTTMIYFKYEELKTQGKSAQLNVLEFIKSYKNEVVTVVVSNFMMLLFGYLGEIGVMERTMALIIGFLFFAFSFYTIYTNFAVKSDVGKRMFGLLVTVWAIYGIAYMFPTVQKNITYNGLDIVAKNFFGVYLYIVIQKLASQK